MKEDAPCTVAAQIFMRYSVLLNVCLIPRVPPFAVFVRLPQGNNLFLGVIEP